MTALSALLAWLRSYGVLVDMDRDDNRDLPFQNPEMRFLGLKILVIGFIVFVVLIYILFKP